MKKIYDLLCDTRDYLDELNIPYGHIQLGTFDNKAYWGYCKQIGNNTYRIELHKILLTDAVSYEEAMNTMIHEVLHAYKDRMCHTGEWKRCANLVNKYYPQFHISRTTSYEDKGVSKTDLTNRIEEAIKYKIVCNKCSNENYYRRRSTIVKLIAEKPVGSCICNICGGNEFRLEVLK